MVRVLCALTIWLAVALRLAAAQAATTAKSDTGVAAYAFDLSQVTLGEGRWHENQNRTLTYLKFVDIDRLLYVYRSNHNLSTKNATPNGGWDAPSFPFRGHVQGHFLTAWAQCYAQLRDDSCKDRAVTFVAELQKCQSNNKALGFNDGYLSGFPESDFDELESGTLGNGNVPYYVLHKLMAGLLDVYKLVGDNNSMAVLSALGAWVDARTEKLSFNQMQKVLETEFGGMSEVLTDMYGQLGDSRWLAVAQRFEHVAVLRPLSTGQDQLNGLHANTQVPKWIGAAREYKATGNQTYQAIAHNAWGITVRAHTYAIGGNSQAEHFRQPDAISGYLTYDTAESCNSYNMLKLTLELWQANPENTTYFDYYEQTLMNQLIGQQNPADSHGHVTYFNSLNPGGRRGVGPAWGGGNWSTDYDSFWCCQGTALETNTKLMDSIYFHDETSLYVNLFVPSVLKWAEKHVTVEQTTTFPVSDTTSLHISGSGTFTLRVRIPAWTSGAVITINGVNARVRTSSGTYASISRLWTSGDVVNITLPMTFRLLPANDNKMLAAVAYGPVVLCGDYRSGSVSTTPTLLLSSLRRTSASALFFSALAGGQTVTLRPYYDAQGVNYVVYWMTTDSLSKS
ncbi:DUF1680-domain-containing protein [Coniochaeta ligniaria NRRL 30616]|uniref:DUF1680-domain-containing protein n=1 Tax=Coniochaeta ligniaria NRRL 30616 TaxID=1408157 RepID=A0A1J7JBF8_9PEZI|nr:DUF1680-domain-containing protein [Coniochaeta ligniaria NRRL 30616]